MRFFECRALACCCEDNRKSEGIGLAKRSRILVSEGARYPIEPVHSLTTPSSRHHTTNVIEPDARHVGLAPTHWRATPRPDGSNCLRAPATRILCQLLATIGAVTCALRETTPKRLTATGLALPSRYRNRGRFSAKTLVHRHAPMSSHLPLPARWPSPERYFNSVDTNRCRFPTTYQHCGRASRLPDTHSANETELRCPGL
jgi:hypothetical protein